MCQCKKCVFFQQIDGRPMGQCRREAPKLVFIPEPSLAGQMKMSALTDAFPPVTPDCWCGWSEQIVIKERGE
jgi:hypothetical protein